ncbi:MAG: hypothetical protein Q4B73_07150 [Lachnospiraceae bacterium]|nr:hypothetical protein [Lachnospiraceae bacterium]
MAMNEEKLTEQKVPEETAPVDISENEASEAQSSFRHIPENPEPDPEERALELEKMKLWFGWLIIIGGIYLAATGLSGCVLPLVRGGAEAQSIHVIITGIIGVIGIVLVILGMIRVWKMTMKKNGDK